MFFIKFNYIYTEIKYSQKKRFIKVSKSLVRNLIIILLDYQYNYVL